jgi:selenocysteine-specific elongation factor
MEIIVGTAGHIDHGKTALVRSLTGTDTDRLPEEKKRGITVDLGFAEMTIGETHFGFVDVPGHERFVKNMLAGATGIDLVLLVIAADEGVMPQTREHFDICRLLGLKSGIVVLTKTDLVDEETLELARLDAADLATGSFLENAPVVPVSAKTGSGLDELRSTIEESCRNLGRLRDDASAARLAIDRSFRIKGFGAVVTGTLASGSIAAGDEIELFPPRKILRVRGVQSHGSSVTSAQAGSRTALNLAGIDHSELNRGMTVASPGVFEPTQIVDCRVEMLSSAPKPLKTRQRVRLHIGTDELLARVYVLNATGEITPGETDFVQLRLEAESVAAVGDRFILRSYSPSITIGGGELIDSMAKKHRKSDLAAVRGLLTSIFESRGDIAEQIFHFVKAAGHRGLSEREIAARTGIKPEAIGSVLGNAASGELIDLHGRLIESAEASSLFGEVMTRLDVFHRSNPLESGMPRVALREAVFAHLPLEVFEGALERLSNDGVIVLEKETVRLKSHSSTLSPAEAAFKAAVSNAVAMAGLQPAKIEGLLESAQSTAPVPAATAKRLLQMLVGSGEIVKVSEEFYFSRAAIDDLVSRLKAFADSSPGRTIDMAEFKALADVSRKHAIPLSEYLDRERITVRRGDKRVII